MKELVLLFRYELWMVVSFPVFEKQADMVTKGKKRYTKVKEIQLLLMFSGFMAAVKLQTDHSGLPKTAGMLLPWILSCCYDLSRLIRVLAQPDSPRPLFLVSGVPWKGRSGFAYLQASQHKHGANPGLMLQHIYTHYTPPLESPLCAWACVQPQLQWWGQAFHEHRCCFYTSRLNKLLTNSKL